MTDCWSIVSIHNTHFHSMVGDLVNQKHLRPRGGEYLDMPSCYQFLQQSIDMGRNWSKPSVCAAWAVCMAIHLLPDRSVGTSYGLDSKSQISSKEVD